MINESADQRRLSWMTGRFCPRAAYVLFTVSAFCLSVNAAVAQTPVAPAHTAAPKPATPRASVAPAAPKPMPAEEGEEVIARVGSSDITAGQVRAFVSTLGLRERTAILRDPAMLSQAVRAMLANQLVLKEALEKKWDQQNAVSAQLLQLRNNAIVETYLQSVSLPANGFPSDAEVEKAYEANKSAFLAPRQFHIAQIFVAFAEGADKAVEDNARKKLSDIQLKLKQVGADFAQIAKAYSDDHDTAERGGEIGWVPEPQLRPEIKAQVMSLVNNTVGDPIKLDDGWHVLKLLDTKAAYVRSLAEVRDPLVQQLRAQRADANRHAYIAKIFEQNPPAINEIALSKVFGESGPSAAR
jgi:hypothetical protein